MNSQVMSAEAIGVLTGLPSGQRNRSHRDLPGYVATGLPASLTGAAAGAQPVPGMPRPYVADYDGTTATGHDAAWESARLVEPSSSAGNPP